MATGFVASKGPKGKDGKHHGPPYYVVIDQGRDVDGRRSLTWLGGKFRTRRDAEKRLVAELNAINVGTAVDRTTETTGAFLARWLRDDVPQRVRPNTAAFYRQIVKSHLAPRIGHIPLQELRAPDVQRVIVDIRRAGLSSATARRAFATIHRALEVALKWGLVPVNVADRIDPPTERREEVVLPSLADTKRLLSVLEGDSYYPAFRLLAFTGLRRSEVAGLRWRDMDFERGTLSVRQTAILVGGKPVISVPKTGAARRTIHVDPATLDVLRGHRDRRVAESVVPSDGFLFPSTEGGPMDPNILSKRWGKACRQTGVRCRLHALRHLHMTHLLANGVDLKTVQARAGHASPAFTLRVYAHALPERDKAAALVFADTLS